jgi:hypothetical protein
VEGARFIKRLQRGKHATCLGNAFRTWFRSWFRSTIASWFTVGQARKVCDKAKRLEERIVAVAVLFNRAERERERERSFIDNKEVSEGR